MRRLLTGVAVLAGALALTPSGVAQADPTPVPCTGTISITSLAFVPPSIAAGSSSTATLAARNCTAQRQQVAATWVGRFVGSPSGPAIPPGCPAIDPLQTPLDFPPGASLTRSVTYLVFKGCTASALHLTVTITKAGQVLATRSADLEISH
jgi:hypothetical protein